MTATATVTPGTAEDSRLTYALLGVVTLVSAALPFVFLSQSADGAHTAFHIIGMLACVAWLLVLARTALLIVAGVQALRRRGRTS